MKTRIAGRMAILAMCSGLCGAMLVGAPAHAQDQGEPGVDAPPPEETVFDGDFLSVGVGAGYGPSYTGSDDYVVFPLPIVQASVGGIDIDPRPAGIAVDFVPDAETGPSFNAGIAAKLNRDRASQIEDPTVELLGELDTAVEVGPTAGVSLPGVLNPYDSLSFTVDAVWDIAGAHDGMTVNPSVTYFTPLSRGVGASLSLSTTYVDDDYADYYYSVSPAQSVTTGGVLPAYQADGGFENVGVNVLLAVDLNGDITDGGFSVVGIGGYSRLLGDAKNTPFTSVVGSADQWLIGAGIGYTF